MVEGVKNAYTKLGNYNAKFQWFLVISGHEAISSNTMLQRI